MHALFGDKQQHELFKASQESPPEDGLTATPQDWAAFESWVIQMQGASGAQTRKEMSHQGAMYITMARARDIVSQGLLNLYFV
jgi:hypothetical protein